ncbi:MAG TPA: GNAT family protein [Actinomycetota bacterium]
MTDAVWPIVAEETQIFGPPGFARTREELRDWLLEQRSAARAPIYRGRGYAAEAAPLVVGFGFEQLSLRRFDALIEPYNRDVDEGGRTARDATRRGARGRDRDRTRRVEERCPLLARPSGRRRYFLRRCAHFSAARPPYPQLCSPRRPAAGFVPEGGERSCDDPSRSCS